MPRLQIFDGESFAPRWLELDSQREVVAGRAADCEVVLLCTRVARHHFKFVVIDGRWCAYDLGSTNGTCCNGERFQIQPLRPGDVVSVGEVAIVYDPPEVSLPLNPQLEAAIARAPGELGPLAVWADWLLEQQHPLAERIARGLRGPRQPDRAWAGYLDDLEPSFTVKFGWSHGLIEWLDVRSHGHPGAYRALVARLLALPAARFLTRLRFELLACERTAPSDVRPALEALIADGVPATLTSLDFGYGEDAEDVVVDAELATRAPGLAGTTVFLGRAQGRLVVERVGPIAAQVGRVHEVRPGHSLRRVPDGLRFAPTEIAPPAFPAPHEARFVRDNGRWVLQVGRELLHPLQVNGHLAKAHGLMHGDLIEFGSWGYRFEVVAASGRAAPLSPAGGQPME